MTPDEIHQLKIAEAQRAHDNETEFGREANKAAVNSGAEALKALLYLNGGSCVIMLAFIGALASKTDKPVANFAVPLVYFALGAGLAVLANAAGYFTNLMITGTSNRKERVYEHPFLLDTPSSKRQRCWGERFRFTAIILAFAALGCFFVGLYFAYGAFKHV